MENIKIDKLKLVEKIDIAFITIMALDIAIQNQGQLESVYSSLSIIFI